MSQVSVGGWIDGWCTSCRSVREHVVVAMVGPRPVKAECTSCHKQHAYRATAPGDKSDKAEKAPKAPRAPVTSRPPGGRARSQEPTLSPAEQLDQKLAGKTPQPYDLKRRFAVGDAVRHPTFGMGVVLALPGPQKMEVLFSVGPKVLMHDRAGAAESTIGRPSAREQGAGGGVPDAPPRK